MIAPIILSKTNSDKADTLFNDTIANEPVTIILVIGDTDQSKRALERINSLLNSDDHFYNGIRVIHAPKIEYIIDSLKKLKVSPRLEAINWKAINSYVLFSISNVFNTIGNVVLSSKYDKLSKYYIEKSIMLALAYDQDLN